MDLKKCCGNCNFWERAPSGTGGTSSNICIVYGKCGVDITSLHLPEALRHQIRIMDATYYIHRMILETGGTDCEFYEPKEIKE
jgi:hypothetical protein